MAELTALVLHGFGMNAQRMKRLLRDVMTTSEGLVTAWHFVDAPNSGRPPVTDGGAKRCEWWNAVENDDGTVHYDGAEQAIAVATQAMREHQANLLIGFSQGAALAAILTARYERGDSSSASPLLAAILLNSGRVPRDPRYHPLFDSPLSTPSLHIDGGAEDITYPYLAEFLHAWSPNTRSQLSHEEGHVPPRLRHSSETLAGLRAWLAGRVLADRTTT